MKLSHVLIVLVAFLSISCCEAQFGTGLDGFINATDLINMPGGRAAVAAAQRIVSDAYGCDANICFAIDGSRALGKRDFELQLQFLAIVSAIVGADKRAHFSGVQYGLRNRAIRTIRGNANEFLLHVERTRWLRSSRSFIDGGVAWCTQQLNKRPGEAAKMVIFVDGRSTYGNRGRLGPVALAKDFRSRSPANQVCAVAVGFSRTEHFTDIVGGDSSLVLEVMEWEQVLNILRALVKDICRLLVVTD